MEWDSIPGTNIIAAVPSKADPSGTQYDILYAVEAKDPSDNPKAAPMSFRAVTVSNLPQDFIDRHSLPSTSAWKGWMANLQFRPNIHVFVSTGSGTGLAQSVWESLVKPMLEYLGVNPTVHFTRSDRTIADAGQTFFFIRANRGLEQHIIFLSGDGGLVDLINSLKSGVSIRTDRFKKPTISLLPLGTGNAMANSTGITADKTMGLATMLKGAPQTVPLFRATFSPGARVLTNEGRDERDLGNVDSGGCPIAHGAVVFSWGLHAALVADSDTTEYRQYGAERFKMAAKEALFPSDGSPPHSYVGKVSIIRSGPLGLKAVDRSDHAYILATFCSHLEAGFNISPASKPLDGKLRLVHFGPTSPEQVMDIMHKAYDGGKHVHDSRIGYEEVYGVRIDFGEEDAKYRRVCIDGKIIRVENGGWVEVRTAKESVVDLLVQ